jgi:hypothetical protein
MVKKIAVLGLGQSVAEFNPEGFIFSIGVNDIWQYVHTDVVVCLDKRGAFTPDRLRTIDNCKPKAFYSQMACWDRRPDFKKIEFVDNYPDRTCDLSGYKFQKSFCSPFVAVQVAYRFYGATEIHLFGVDMVDHPHLNKGLLEKIKIHFSNLKRELIKNGCRLIIHGDGILKGIT